MTGQDAMQLPAAIDAERSVLGALMLDPTAITKVDWLAESDFFRADHRVIFRAITALAGRGLPCDAITLGEWFDREGLAQEAGGRAYPVELANNTPSAANVVAYADIVAEQSRKRQAIDAAQRVIAEALDRGRSSVDVAAAAMQRFSQLPSSRLAGGLEAVKPLLREWYSDLFRRYEIGDRVTGLPAPWLNVNAATHGLQDGELIVLAARPNMGKSVAGFQLAMCAALVGHRSAVFSLEMTATQVMRRCVSALAEVPHEWLLAPSGGADAELYWGRVTRAMEGLTKAPLLIDDTPQLTIDQICARARRAHLQQQLRLVVVDHLHIIRRPGENEVRELGQISAALKGLAKDLRCPVVALAQLNRQLTSRPDKRPMMSDLRASGELEQDADVILFLHREDYYDRNTHLRGVVEMEIGKGRDVRTGQRIHLANRFDIMRLDDWVGDLPEPPVVERPAPRSGLKSRGSQFDSQAARAGE